MIAAEIILRARAGGLDVAVAGADLVVGPHHILTEDLRATLRAAKKDIVAALLAEVPHPDLLPDDLRDAYEERAAIVEACAGKPRAEAERSAWWIAATRLAQRIAGR